MLAASQKKVDPTLDALFASSVSEPVHCVSKIIRPLKLTPPSPVLSRPLRPPGTPSSCRSGNKSRCSLPQRPM